MKKISFSILEYKAFYASDEIKEPKKDSDGNLILPFKTFEAIENFYYANSDVQQYFMPAKKFGKKAFRAQNYVGVIQTKDGTTIEILPKISNLEDDQNEDGKIVKTKEDKLKEILIKMLKTLKKSPFKEFNKANLISSKMPLLEIFISMFLEELSKLVQKGIKSDYITKEENLKFLKGKLLIGQQLKHNTIHKERFYVQFQEFLSNRVENRLIKTTLEYLYKKSKSNINQQRIREFLFVFDEIEVSHTIKTDFEKVSLNRQMKDYEQVLLWCKTFLFGNSFSPYKGNDIAFALLFDMNLLFESYVGDYLKKKGYAVSLQDKGKHLVEEPKKFALRPDIVIHKDNNESMIIADTKWKIIKEEKDINQPDMYQLFAYGKKYYNKKLYLIYPDHLEKPTYELKYQYDDNLDLEVLFFDVTKKHDENCFQLRR